MDNVPTGPQRVHEPTGDTMKLHTHPVLRLLMIALTTAGICCLGLTACGDSPLTGGTPAPRAPFWGAGGAWRSGRHAPPGSDTTCCG